MIVAFAFVQDPYDVFREHFPFSDPEEQSDDHSAHLVEKSVPDHDDDDQRLHGFNPALIQFANGVLYLVAMASGQGAKISLAHEQSCGLAHALQIETTGDMPSGRV